MHEHRGRRPERRLGGPAVARDQVGGEDSVVARIHAHTPCRGRMSSPRGSLRPRAAAARRAVRVRRRLPPPTRRATRSTAHRGGRGPFRGGRPARGPAGAASHHSTGGSGRGLVIAWTSTSVRAWSPSIFTNTSPTRRVAQSWWATTTSTSWHARHSRGRGVDVPTGFGAAARSHLCGAVATSVGPGHDFGGDNPALLLRGAMQAAGRLRRTRRAPTCLTFGTKRSGPTSMPSRQGADMAPVRLLLVLTENDALIGPLGPGRHGRPGRAGGGLRHRRRDAERARAPRPGLRFGWVM